MRFLRTNTAVIITVGPFYDKTDGVTIETALTITNERITLTADTDAGSAPTNILDNVTGATAATANDLNYITGNDAGLMQLELAAADVNRLGRMFLTITDAANHVPVFHEFMVMPALIYDTFFASSGGATFPAATLASTTNITAAAGCAVSSIGANVVTATAINADAITAAKIADGAIDAATFAAGAINAAAIAADAITDAKVASDVTIASVTGAVGSVTGLTAATVHSDLDDIQSKIGTPAGASVSADILAIDNFVDDLESRLGTPSNLGSGATIAANLVDIEGQTDDIGAAGAGLTAITAKTDNLPSDPADASVVAGLIAAVEAKVDIIDTNVDDIETVVITNAAGVDIAADIIAIKAETASILTDTAEIGTAGAGLTNINLPNQTMDIIGNITGNVSGSVGSVTNPVTVGTMDATALANFFDVDSTSAYGSAINGSVVKEIADNAGGGTPPTVGQIADAVWDEAIAGHAGVGSTGEALSDAGGAGTPPTVVEIRTELDTNSTKLSAIVADTNELQTDWVNGGRLDLILDARASQTSVDDVPTNAELATAFGTADDAVLTQVALVKAKTDNLPASPAAVGDIPTAAVVADAVWDELKAGHAVPDSFGDYLDDEITSRASQASVDALNNLSSAQAQTAATAALAAYDPPTRAEATTDKDEVITQVNANETKIDTLQTAATAIKGKTDNLPALPSAVSDIPTAIQNADALLKRDWTAVTGEAARSALNALRFIRNKFSTTATPGSVTVYKEDDIAVAFTKTVTTNAAADPIVEG